MIERIPIKKAEKLKQLNEKEVIEGYLDGYRDEPEAGDNRSFSYWHGYQNGKADRTSNTTQAQIELAKDYIINHHKNSEGKNHD
jgi:hypothetical protein